MPWEPARRRRAQRYRKERVPSTSDREPSLLFSFPARGQPSLAALDRWERKHRQGYGTLFSIKGRSPPLPGENYGWASKDPAKTRGLVDGVFADPGVAWLA